jgi:hypothetical protein
VEKFEELVKKSEKLDFLSGMIEAIEKRVRMEIFKEFVKNEQFAIDREVCGMFLGFEVD